jgi:predicted transcriptional regulator
MTRVSHPLLRLEVLRSDGSRMTEERVFCRQQRRSVAAGSCRTCDHCVEVAADPEPAIVCAIRSEPLVDEPEIGTILRGRTVVIEPGTPIGEALSIMRAEERRSVAVVDEGRTLVGIVHEVTFVRPMKGEDVTAAMSSGLALHEATPVRRALRLLASAHLREAIVVDDDGVPLGTFRDVDGLRWIARTRPPGS